MQLNIPYIYANYRIFCGRLHKLNIAYMKLNITLNLRKLMHAVYECSLDLELNMTTYITFHILILIL